MGLPFRSGHPSTVVTRAVVDDENIGDIGPAPDQGHLGDFWLPQRGVFAIGASYFEAFDPERHQGIRSDS